jgi:hypothetical protein
MKSSGSWRKKRIIVSARGGGIRVSLDLYNNE